MANDKFITVEQYEVNFYQVPCKDLKETFERVVVNSDLIENMIIDLKLKGFKRKVDFKTSSIEDAIFILLEECSYATSKHSADRANACIQLSLALLINAIKEKNSDALSAAHTFIIYLVQTEQVENAKYAAYALGNANPLPSCNSEGVCSIDYSNSDLMTELFDLILFDELGRDHNKVCVDSYIREYVASIGVEPSLDMSA